MSTGREPEEAPAAKPRRRVCASCGSERLAKLGRLHSPIYYVDGGPGFLAQAFTAALRVCEDCRLIHYYMDGDSLDRALDRMNG